MLNKTVLCSIFLSSLLFNSSSIHAKSQGGELDGRYIAKKGWAESLELYLGENTGEQLGKYKMVLVREGWSSLSVVDRQRIRNKLVLKGVFHGVIENALVAPVVNHQFSNHARDGVLFTENDIVNITGVAPCSQTGGLTFNIVETLNLQYGTGIYADLQPGGTITVTGTVNQCTAQNDFEVAGGVGGICFGDSCD